jgi:Ring finger domain
MRSLCRCFFRYCCDSRGRDDDNNDRDDPNGDHPIEQRNVEGRPLQSYSSVSAYAYPIEGQGLITLGGRGELQQSFVGIPTSTTDMLNENGDNGNINSNCCQPNDPNSPSIYDCIRQKMNQWRNSYGAVLGVDGEDDNEDSFLSSAKRKNLPSTSPLRQAISFNSSRNRNVPFTINADEIVLPGSMLQHQMAQQMISTGDATTFQLNVDECVICMEQFDASNPRMPTLCNCGVNKTYFHLPCLYQWIEQSLDCPSCRTKITWEEF